MQMPKEQMEVLNMKAINAVFNRFERNNSIWEKMLFEILYYLLSVAYLIIQNLNIRQYVSTNSWYSHNYTLFIYSAIFLSKRCIFILWIKLQAKSPVTISKQKFVVIMLFVLILFDFLYTLIKLFISNPISSSFCLLYPPILQCCIFWPYTPRYVSPTNELFHIIKSVVYHSFELCYFTGFVPVKFLTDEKMIYEPFSTMYLTFFFWSNSFIMLFAHFVMKKAGELKEHARRFGSWKRISSNIIKREHIYGWASGSMYREGMVVEYNNMLYMASGGPHNQSKPGDLLSTLLYNIFSQPQRTFLLIEGAMCLILILEFIVLLANTPQLIVYAITIISSTFIFFYLVKISHTIQIS